MLFRMISLNLVACHLPLLYTGAEPLLLGSSEERSREHTVNQPGCVSSPHSGIHLKLLFAGESSIQERYLRPAFLLR